MTAGSKENPEQVTRRDVIRRGALVGAAAVWVTPTMQVIGMGRGHAQTASAPPPPPPPPPPEEGGSGKGISFAAFRFTCNGTTYFAKIEGNSVSSCEGPNSGENCGISDSGAANGCGLFTTQTTFTDGELTRVVVTLTCSGSFVAGAAKAGQACYPASISGSVATFQT